jgi:hypothetical protein
MKNMIIFDPAMCCSTGVCGPSVNPELLRVSAILNNLKNKGIIVERYNLTGNPEKFVENKEINAMLNEDGVDILPVIIVDGIVVKTKGYPSDEEFCSFLEITPDYIKPPHRKIVKIKKCNCGDGCC